MAQMRIYHKILIYQGKQYHFDQTYELDSFSSLKESADFVFYFKHRSEALTLKKASTNKLRYSQGEVIEVAVGWLATLLGWKMDVGRRVVPT